MQQRRFGAAGPAVGTIGQGTWQLEGRRRQAIETLRQGIELGLDHIDTAEIYGDGAVEALVGEALEGRRERVLLVSKIEPSRATPEQAPRACEESLTRLRTDCLDVYLLHWLPPHRLEVAIAAMEALVESGRIRRWGVSNFDEVKLEEAIRIAGPGRIACNQILYHLAERSVEHAVIPCCQRHGVAAVGYSPFAAGAFPAPDSPGGRTLAAIAERHGATPHQVALAFLTRLDGTFSIPRASRPDHVRDNAGTANLTLDHHDIRQMDAAFPLGARPRGLPMW